MLILDSSQRAFHAAKDYQAKQRENLRQVQADARAKEEQAFAPDGDIPTTSLEACIGQPMMHSEVMKRIHKLNDNLICLQSNSNPNGIGVYVRDSQANKHDIRYSGIRYTGISFEKGYLPEFDIHHTSEEEYWDDEAKVFKTRPILDPNHPLTRGWWTLVMRLIAAQYVEKTKTLTAFKRLPTRSSKKWRDTIGA